MRHVLLLVATVAALGVAALPARAESRGQLRTVVVVPSGTRMAPLRAQMGARDCIRYARTCVNGIAGIELAYAVGGDAPARTTLGTVLTDTNCAADAYGVSHCLNRIRLANGRVLLVRHDHSMANDPCLAPGERVRVRRLG